VGWWQEAATWRSRASQRCREELPCSERESRALQQGAEQQSEPETEEEQPLPATHAIAAPSPIRPTTTSERRRSEHEHGETRDRAEPTCDPPSSSSSCSTAPTVTLLRLKGTAAHGELLTAQVRASSHCTLACAGCCMHRFPHVFSWSGAWIGSWCWSVAGCVVLTGCPCSPKPPEPVQTSWYFINISSHAMGRGWVGRARCRTLADAASSGIVDNREERTVHSSLYAASCVRRTFPPVRPLRPRHMLRAPTTPAP
jgi:hypothetical protein